MKKYFLLLVIFAACFSSCRKIVTNDTTTSQAATDDALIQAYIKQYNVTATKDPSGLYYQIITPGTGAHPTDASNITVGYTFTLIDGTVIENRSSTYFSNLGGLVQGWRIGLPKIGTGGKILLLIPSALGYGTTGSNSVPANAVLVYTITLQGFN